MKKTTKKRNCGMIFGVVLCTLVLTACAEENVNLPDVVEPIEVISSEENENRNTFEDESIEGNEDRNTAEDESMEGNEDRNTAEDEGIEKKETEESKEDMPEQISAEPVKENQSVEEMPSEKNEVGQSETNQTEQNIQPKVINSIRGRVTSKETGSFVISQIFTDQSSDNLVAVKDKENEQKVNVLYTEQTSFVIRTSTDGGITFTDEMGIKDDISTEQLVVVEGSWENNDYIATKVIICYFS